MRHELSVNKAKELLARIRPGDDVAALRLQIARDHHADIRASRPGTSPSWRVADSMLRAGELQLRS